jgi:xylulokinase
MRLSGKSLLLGVDLGTTVCRCLVFDTELRLLASAARELQIHTLSGTEIEQDAVEWWRTTVQVVREALAAAGAEGDEVSGLSASTQGISFVPVDKHHRPLRSAFSWLDTRAKPQRQQVLARLSEWEVFSITGKRCQETYVLPKLLWFREHQPELFAACDRLLMSLDFLLARLTGETMTDHTMASGTMLYDVGAGAWSERIIQGFGLPPALLPELRRGGTPVGRLRPEAAAELGLGRQAVVAMGGQDQKVAALGAGIDLSATTVSLGTAMAITQKADRPMIDPGMRIPCFADLFPGRWVVEGSGICCSILDWLRQSFFPRLSYAEMDRLAEAEENRGEPLFLFPFFSGAYSPHYRADARGFLYGLNLATTPGQLVRCVLEGIAFQIRENLEVMEQISRPVRELRVFGGGARSEPWCRIIAEVTGIPVAVPEASEAAATGAAILAGMGAGVYQDAEEALGLLRVRRIFEPRPEAMRRYQDLYRRYREIEQRIFGIGE